jgi:insecticidal toxin complex protein TccC
VQTTLIYNPEDGRLAERQALRAGQVLQHLRYVYDPMGNVLSIEDAALAVRYFANQRIDPISRFVYDSLYKLIQATGWEAGSANQGPDSLRHNDPAAVSNYQQTYRYDEGGNLLTLVHVGAQSHGREIQAARYSNRCLPYRNGVPPTEDEIAAAFDARGNCLELDAGRFLAWDLRNQLGSVTPIERSSGLNDSEAYIYDSGGQRVRKLRTLQTDARTLAAEVRYLPGLELRADSGTGEALQVITAQGGLSDVRVLHWESAPPTGENDCYRYSVADHLGSVSLELAQDGRVISREHFYPFGETAYLAGDDAVEVGYKTVRYSGKERDATGLYYYGFRYYTPWLQRWVNPDPAGAVDGLNGYRMVRNNPVGWFDDNGLMPVETGNGAVASGVAKKSVVSDLKSRFESQTAGALRPATSANISSRFGSRTAKVPPPATFANTPGKGGNDSTSIPTGVAFSPLKFTEAGEDALSTSDVSMRFKPATIIRNGLEVSVERLVVTFKKKFDLVEGKSLPEWPRGYELVPSQDWANESGIKEYEKFHVLEGAERERAVALIKAKDQAALKVGLGTPTYAYDSDAKVITLKDGHHRFIAAARLGRTIELDSSRVPTSNLKWKNLKFSAKQPLKV